MNVWIACGYGTSRPRCTKALFKRALCAPYQNYSSPVALPKLQMTPKFILLISSDSRKNGAQMRMPEWDQGFTFTENVGRGFLFYCTPPAQRTVYQPQQVKVSSAVDVNPASCSRDTRLSLHGRQDDHSHPSGVEINLLKPNDIYICRTAALTSRRYILNIYSTNIHTEYSKHAA
jgi:hypothetical protein